MDFVRMQGAGFDVSFTKDGNLFQTLANSYSGGTTAFVNAVINASGGKINDTPNLYDTPAYSGYHTLSSIDFDTSSGTVSWFGAQAYVNYLNSIHYGGSQQWSLPSWIDNSVAGLQEGGDYGYSVNPSTNPLAQLYYNELGKKGYYSPSGQFQNGYGIFDNNGRQITGGVVGPLTNVQSNLYWSGTESLSPTGGFAWFFGADEGSQYNTEKLCHGYAWAVSPGQVAAVPVPGAIWLFGTGLVGLAGLKRRGHAG